MSIYFLLLLFSFFSLLFFLLFLFLVKGDRRRCRCKHDRDCDVLGVVLFDRAHGRRWRERFRGRGHSRGHGRIFGCIYSL